MSETKIIQGRVLYCDATSIYCARGRRILVSEDGGESWRDWTWLPSRYMDRAAVAVPLLARLLRKGIYHLAFSDGVAVAIANKQSFSISGGAVTCLGPLVGSRPLVLCHSDGVFYYGEYRSNMERSPVYVWKWQEGAESWSPVWQFEDVRHIHGVFHDPYTGALWVTTGDNNNEAAIWRTEDGFSTLNQVAGGSQQLRAVQLLFTKDYVYFGSDAPQEKNHIFRMNREGTNIECLVRVESSVFYGDKVGDSLCFSTAVEPSLVNTTRCVGVWCSRDGSNWKKLLKFRKDIWPMGYFQYGQVLFPAGPGDGRHLYCTPFATKGHGRTFVVNLGMT